MIASLKGIIQEKTLDSVVVETGGLGFLVTMSQTSLAKLPDVGDVIQIHTYLQVREDAFLLFGFLTSDEKQLFMRLISVSGVGPKVALAALSAYTSQELIAHITAQDITAISRVSGVGKKTASRIVLELKGSFDHDTLNSLIAAEPSDSFVMRGVAEALLSMGFTSQEVDLALKNAPEQGNEAALLQHALKKLGS